MAEEQDGVDQAGKQQCDNVFPMTGGDASLHEVPFAEKSTGRRHSDHCQRTDSKRRHGDRHACEQALHFIDGMTADAAEENAGGEKQAQRHESIADDVIARSDDAVVVAEPDTTDHVTNLGDNQVTEHFLELLLRQRQYRAGDDGNGGEHDDELAPTEVHEDILGTEDRQHDADHDVDRDLGHQRRENAAAGGRREGVGIRQPAVEREEGHLDPDADGDQHEGDQDRFRFRKILRNDGSMDVAHVERARAHIEVANAEQVKRSTDSAHDDVVECGERAALRLSHGDESVAGQRRHLDEYEQVERICGDRHAHQGGTQQQVERVERGAAPRCVFGNALAGVDRCQQGYSGNDHQHASVQRIHAKFDTYSGVIAPAAHEIRHGSVSDHLAQQGNRGEQSAAQRSDGNRKAHTLVPDTGERGDQRREHRRQHGYCSKMLSHDRAAGRGW